MRDIDFGDDLREPERKRRSPTKHPDNKVGQWKISKGKMKGIMRGHEIE